ncbi:MAG: late competence development ComFB family protein [Lachnospiraceae bacterium]|nr:late competence development ComFB family protein [Lachnospiraceae bacterium]
MKIITKNLMEAIVEQKLDSMIDKLGCCKCDVCRMDILCYTLNRLPPKYVATTQGELLSRIDSLSSTFDISIVTTITNAAEVVRQHPRHDLLKDDNDQQ